MKVKNNNSKLMTIFLVVFMDLFGFGIILPLLPYIAEKFSATAATIGFITASYSLFQFISGPILGELSDRFGRKKLLIISQLGSMLGYILLGLAGSVPLIFLARIIDGITGGNISIAQAYMADITDEKTRAKGMGLLGAAFGLGFMLGPAIGGYLSTFGYAVPAYFAAVVAGLTTLATTFFLTETVNTQKAARSPKTKLSLGKLKEIMLTEPIGLLIASFFLLSLGFSVIQGTYALFVQARFNWGPKEVGYLFGLIGIIAIIAQVKVLPFFISKFGQRKTLITSVPIMAAGFYVIVLADNIPAMITANILIPLGNALANPTISALATEKVPPEEYGSALGILQSAGSLGRILGPIIGGELFYRFAPETPFTISAIILLAVFFLLFTRLKTRL